MGFSTTLALRFLGEGRLQSLLIVAGAVVGIGVMVFLTALIGGLQASLVRQTLGSQAHVVLSAPERDLASLAASGEALVSSSIQRPPERLTSIPDWPRAVERASGVSGVIAVAPVVAGAALASKGEAVRSILLQGMDPETFDRVIPISDRLVAGRLDVSGASAVLGADLARELGVGVGDKLRIEVTAERSAVVTVAGLLALANQEVDGRWALVSLKQGQTLLDLAGGASSLLVRVDEVFEAQAIGGALARRTGLEAESWMESNQQLLVALRSQSSSSTMISFFVVVAVALGIASVLSVSVMQKGREIGILKAMGARTRQILVIFLLQGLLVGLGGAVGGSLLGAGLALTFQGLVRSADGSPTFPVDLGPQVWIGAALVALITGVVASVAPARRAARLDPAEVIRHG